MRLQQQPSLPPPITEPPGRGVEETHRRRYLRSYGELAAVRGPLLTYDGNGGAIFDWYTGGPALQCYAQHILADGTEAFPAQRIRGLDQRRQRQGFSPPLPTARPAMRRSSILDRRGFHQFTNGVSGQKFDGTGTRKWGSTGVTIVPLESADEQIFVENVQTGAGALVYMG